jgi:hypothetical protein
MRIAICSISSTCSWKRATCSSMLCLVRTLDDGGQGEVVPGSLQQVTAKGKIRDFLRWLKGLEEACVGSEEEHLDAVLAAGRKSWGPQSHLAAIPLMMDVYYMFAPILYADSLPVGTDAEEVAFGCWSIAVGQGVDGSGSPAPQCGYSSGTGRVREGFASRERLPSVRSTCSSAVLSRYPWVRLPSASAGGIEVPAAWRVVPVFRGGSAPPGGGGSGCQRGVRGKRKTLPRV